MTAKTKRTIKKYAFVYSLLLYPLILFAVFYVYININSILMAFQSISSSGEKTFVGFENFRDFFNRLQNPELDPNLKTSLLNSVKLYFIGLIGHPIALFTAYYIFKKKALHRIYAFIVMIPDIVSIFVITIVFKKFIEGGLPSFMKTVFGVEDFPMLLVNKSYTFPTVVFFAIWSTMASAILMQRASMGSIDASILESAHIDGVNYFQELWYIVFPMISGVIATGFITGIGGLFAASGPLVSFWMYSAPPETWLTGYYMTQRVMTNLEDPSGYALLSAMGLLFTAIIVPITLLIKKLFDRIVPEV